MDEVTFVVKTLERPRCLFRLLRSIFRYDPEAIVLIGDDSEISGRKETERRFPGKNITYLDLPHDCGLSYGRNELVRRVKTPYFVLLDDDFVLDGRTDFVRGLQILKEQELDILGGYFRNYPVTPSPVRYLKDLVGIIRAKSRKYNYIGQIHEAGSQVVVQYETKRFPEFERTDIVHNFFIADTEVIRERCLWDDSIKVHEHTPFFIKAKRRGLKVGFTNCMSIKHKPYRPKKYQIYRGRDFRREWMKLYGFTEFIFTTDGGEEKRIRV